MTVFENQKMIPAVRHIRDFEDLLTRELTYIVLLESHLTQLPSLLRTARQHDKKVILHADLIQGLKHDEAAAQFLCQMIKPAGLISTHSVVIATAKKNRLLGIQRVFLIDSHSLDTSFRVLANSKPDFIEVLPGVLPDILREVKARTQLPILAGGFIRTREEIAAALSSGAAAVTTSHRSLWDFKATQKND